MCRGGDALLLDPCSKSGFWSTLPEPFLPCLSGGKKPSEGHPFLPVWLFFISLKSVNLKESATLWEWVGCSLIRAIRQEINTAVGPQQLGRFSLQAWQAQGTKSWLSHGLIPERFINVFLQEMSKISARHSMINQLNINVDMSLAALKSLPLVQNMIFFENGRH